MTTTPRRLPEVRTSGNELRRRRVGRGWSQARLADVATALYPGGHPLRYSISLSSVKRAEAGGPVLWPTLRALAEALDTDPVVVLADGEAARVGVLVPPGSIEPADERSGAASALQIHTRLHCLSIYHQIVFDGRGSVSRGELTAERYWCSLFFHLCDQHRLWLDEAIDDPTYALWLRQRRWDWEMNEAVGTIAFREAWSVWWERIGDAGFSEAMRKAFEGDVEGAMSRPVTPPVRSIESSKGVDPARPPLLRVPAQPSGKQQTGEA